MRQLFVVEAETQGGHVVVATSDGLERFALEVDQALRAAVTDRPAVRPRTDAAPPSTEPRISPREIQVRIRAGEEPAVLAEACGAGLDWVLRFAGPVLSERARVADESRRAKARRRSDGLDEGQLVVFGEAVDARFAAHGIDPADVRWDAHRRDDGQWAITARWIGGESEHTAEWIFQLSSRTVAPVDDTAVDLLSDRPIRPLLPAVEPEPTPTLTVAPPLMPGVVAFPVMSHTDTGPLPTPAHASLPTPAHAYAEPEPVEVASRSDEPTPPPVTEPDEPVLPMDVPDAPEVTSKIPKVSAMPSGRRRAESDDERAARATVPKWDEILLGVRRKRD